MKKFFMFVLVLILSLSICALSFAESEDSTDEQDQELDTTISADDLVLESETYSEWADLAWPIIRNYYVQSTWITDSYFRTSRYDYDTVVNLDFLLVEDALALTTNQATNAGKLYTYLEDSYPVSKYSEGNRGKVLVYAYNLLHSAPSVLEKLVELHDSITVPTEYSDFDSLILKCISNLQSVSEKFRKEITDVGTIGKNWSSGLNRTIFEQIDAIYTIMK